MKKKKFLKKFGLALLAGFMFCLPVLGAACTPLLALPENETPPVLALDPATDPTVYTTQQGLEIKKSNGYISSSVTTTTNNNKTHTQNLSGFYYFTMGSFSGTIYSAKTQTDTYTLTNEPVNWLIIGRGEFDFYDDTPAGSDIQNDVNDQEIALQGCYLPMSMSVIPQNDEISKNSFLVLSEKLLGLMYFNSGGNLNTTYYTQDTNGYIHCGDGGYGNRYRYKSDAKDPKAGAVTWNNKVDGSLYTYINSLFSKNASTGAIISNQLGLTKAESDLIVPQQLYTYYANGSTHLQETPTTDSGTYYTMFPLAYKTANLSVHQSFCMEDYLPNQNQRIASIIGSNQCHFWYLRSGTTAGPNRSCTVLPSGASNTDWGNSNSYATRPAMVIKLQ